MSKSHLRAYVDIKFNAEQTLKIARANQIIEEYESKGMQLTVRQLYYQHVARGLIENVPENYRRLAKLISDGRLAGLISWTAIEDRGRNLKGLSHFDSPDQALEGLVKQYSVDKWADQKFRPEVWIEKEALEGVISSICNELEVDFFACRGYNSQSEQWRAGRRFANYVSNGQTPIVFHLGDHDPSGIDMTRDNQERLSMFAGVPVQVTRLALNMEQIRRLNPPPNPAKLNDPRAGDYIREHGLSSWELDALDPVYIRELIRDAVVRVRDQKTWDESVKQENLDRETLEEMRLGAQDDD